VVQNNELVVHIVFCIKISRDKGLFKHIFYIINIYYIMSTGTIPVGSNYGDYPYWNGSEYAVADTFVVLGQNAGQISQNGDCIAIGPSAGQYTQGVGGGSCIAIGMSAAQYNQSYDSIAIGMQSAQIGQAADSVAIGIQAAQFQQGYDSVAIGTQSGQSGQGNLSVAIGYQAGQVSQLYESVAIGYQAGQNAQQGGVAIGQSAGKNTQGIGAIAIGKNAGIYSQPAYAIAIGADPTGSNTQSGQSIILNAGSSTITDSGNAGLFVYPIRTQQASIGSYLQYNAGTHEVTSATGPIMDSVGSQTISLSGTVNLIQNVITMVMYTSSYTFPTSYANYRLFGSYNLFLNIGTAGSTSAFLSTSYTAGSPEWAWSQLATTSTVGNTGLCGMGIEKSMTYSGGSTITVYLYVYTTTSSSQCITTSNTGGGGSVFSIWAEPA
jgi:hypothetical protein